MTRAAAPATAPAITPLGWALIVLRSLTIVVFLAACLLLYALFVPFTRRNPVAPFFLGGVARIVGVRYRGAGERPRGTVILLANHISWIDVLALAGLTNTAFVAQDGLAKVAWLRWLCELNDTVFIARDRRQTIAQQVKQVRAALHDIGVLTIFPEGTTGDGIELLAFKSSLLSALEPVPQGTTVQPVWLDYGNDARRIAWVGDEPGLDNYLRIAARFRPITLTAHFLAPLAGESLADRKTIAAATCRAIARAADQRVAL